MSEVDVDAAIAFVVFLDVIIKFRSFVAPGRPDTKQIGKCLLRRN